MSSSEIQRLISKLPAKERGMLAAWLLKTLPPHSDEDAGAEDVAEATRRREEIETGRVRPISSDEFWESISQERASWK